MDSFFGIGAPELILILIIAGMVMGPERIVRTARWLGRTSAQLQGISRTFMRQLNAELTGIDNEGEMTNAWGEVQDLRRQLADLKKEITSVATQPVKEGQQAIRDARDEVENTIKPPTIGKDVSPEEEIPEESGESVLEVKEPEVKKQSHNAHPWSL